MADYFLAKQNCPFLTLKEFKKEIIIRGKARPILFTGGEPTLNKNLITFIKLARNTGYKDIALQTNGRRLSYKKYCFELIKNGVNEINISIHGSKEKIHDG